MNTWFQTLTLSHKIWKKLSISLVKVQVSANIDT
jgi:hypothetical protein